MAGVGAADLLFMFENACVEAVVPGNRVLVDTVYGAEEVISRDVFTSPYGVAVRLGLIRPERDQDPGGLRYIVRLVAEPVVRVLLLERDALREIQLSAEDLAIDVVSV